MCLVFFREFDPEYKIVASSFQKTEDPSKVFFGHLDFNDGQAVYQKVYLLVAAKATKAKRLLRMHLL